MQSSIKRLFLSCTMLSLCTVPCALFSEQNNKQLYIPQDAVVAFDVHKVLQSLNKRRLMDVVYNFSDKWNLALLSCNPLVWKRVYEIRQTTHCVQAIYDSLSQEYSVLKQDNFKQLFYNLANSQDPIKQMIDFASDLKANGYSLYIASNIGDKVWSDLVKKQRTFGDLFPEGHVLCAHSKKDKNGKETDYIEKPQQDFFKELRNLVDKNGDRNKKIVFFDDKQKNIVAAQQNKKLNIIGQLFDLKKVAQETSLYRRIFGLQSPVAKV